MLSWRRGKGLSRHRGTNVHKGLALPWPKSHETQKVDHLQGSDGKSNNGELENSSCAQMEIQAEVGSACMIIIQALTKKGQLHERTQGRAECGRSRRNKGESAYLPFDKVEARCRFYHMANLTWLQIEGSILKLLLHIAFAKKAPKRM